MIRLTPTYSFADFRGRVFLTYSHIDKRFANDVNTIVLPSYDKIDAGVIKLDLPPAHPASGMEGKKVTVGIRPEDVYDSANNCPVPVTDGNSFTARVDVLEKLGSEDTAYLVIDETNITATLDPATRIETGETANFAIDLDRIHIFDSETENAIR